MTFNCPICNFYSDDKDESKDHVDEHIYELDAEYSNSDFGEEEDE